MILISLISIKSNIFFFLHCCIVQNKIIDDPIFLFLNIYVRIYIFCIAYTFYVLFYINVLKITFVKHELLKLQKYKLEIEIKIKIFICIFIDMSVNKI